LSIQKGRVVVEAANVKAEPRSVKHLFTPEEVNALIPLLETIFREMDFKAVRIRELTELVKDVEDYWGEALKNPQNPDRAKYEGMKKELEQLSSALEGSAGKIRALGGDLKDYQQGLVDFLTERGGEIVYICWQRGEKVVGFWHTLDGGFAGRRPLR